MPRNPQRGLIASSVRSVRSEVKVSEVKTFIFRKKSQTFLSQKTVNPGPHLHPDFVSLAPNDWSFGGMGFIQEPWYSAW